MNSSFAFNVFFGNGSRAGEPLDGIRSLPPKRALPSLPKPSAPGSEAKAFTLMEVLVATAIFSIVLAAINITFFSAFRLRAKTTRLLERIMPVNQALGIIKKDLKGVLPPGGAMAGQFLCDSTGNSKLGRLDFNTTSGTILSNAYWGDIQTVAYYLKAPDSLDTTNNIGMDLIRGVTHNQLPVMTSEIEETPLLQGVETLEFEFYNGTEWKTSWDSQTASPTMPVAVRVVLGMAPADDEEQRGSTLKNIVELVVPITIVSATNSASSSTTTAGGQ